MMTRACPIANEERFLINRASCRRGNTQGLCPLPRSDKGCFRVAGTAPAGESWSMESAESGACVRPRNQPG